MFKKHPRGLTVLFFTEMWERFGFYLMLGIFFLYMTDSDRNGLGMSSTEAADIYGTYIALVYLTPFIGGLLADRILGYRKAIFIGGILMGLGYLGLAIPGTTFFYPALLCIIFGNGFFKPNISTLVGNLYVTEEAKALKDSGYNIFYMGINIGAFVCNFIAAYLRNEFGWSYAFGAAGIGMFVGVIWFFFGQKHIIAADVKKPVQKEDMPLSQIMVQVFVPLLVAGAIGYFLPKLLLGTNLLGSPQTDAFLFASIPVAIFFISLWVKASKQDKEPIGALLSIFVIVIIFWAVFHQNGAALTIWARDYTNREMPGVIAPVAETMKFSEEVFTNNVQVTDTAGNSVYIPAVLINPNQAGGSKIVFNVTSTSNITAAVDTTGKVVTQNAPDPYYIGPDRSEQNPQVPVSERPADGKTSLISTEIFQSINPGFVVLLTPLVVGFWAFMRRKKKEFSTPGKIGLGLLLSALSTTLMMLAVVTSGNGEVKSSMMWLVGTYFVITIGELMLSPMGLSLVSKLSPPRLTALMMGGWFLSTSIGNKLSGVLSGLWGVYDNKVYFFLVNFVLLVGAAIVIFVMLKWLRRIVQEHTGAH